MEIVGATWDHVSNLTLGSIGSIPFIVRIISISFISTSFYYQMLSLKKKNVACWNLKRGRYTNILNSMSQLFLVLCFLHLCVYICDLLSCVQLFSTPWTAGSMAHGILQAKILEWVAISFSRGFSWPRDRALVSCRFSTVWATREDLHMWYRLASLHALMRAKTKARTDRTMLKTELLSHMYLPSVLRKCNSKFYFLFRN